MLRCHAVALASIVLLAGSWPTSASDDDSPHRNIRTTDRRLRTLLDEGARISETFQRLVQRLERSDVVVYVVCDGPSNARIAGRLMFVSAAAGVRYVVIRVVRLPRAQQIAILGHELQHAVEIAADPSIIDTRSLARAYSRIGHATDRPPAEGIAFDTEAAVLAGRRVLEEVESHSSSQFPASNSQRAALEP